MSANFNSNGLSPAHEEIVNSLEMVRNGVSRYNLRRNVRRNNRSANEITTMSANSNRNGPSRPPISEGRSNFLARMRNIGMVAVARRNQLDHEPANLNRRIINQATLFRPVLNVVDFFTEFGIFDDGLYRLMDNSIKTIIHTSNTGVDLECAICLVGFKELENVSELACHHKFHLDCIKKWILMKNSCPLCRECILKAKNV